MSDTNLIQELLQWIHRQKPVYLALKTATLKATDYVGFTVVQNWPIICSWLVYFGRLSMVVSELWLDCSLRGMGSLLHLDSTAYFVLLWCSVLSTTEMSGIFFVLISLGISCLAAPLLGFAPAILIIAVLGVMMLWMYGSFWITGALIIIGGSLFTLNHARLAILITTIYSMYCAKVRVGWVGLGLGIHLAFISNDILIYLLKSSGKENEKECFNEQAEETQRRAKNFNNPSRRTASNDQPSEYHKSKSAGESSQTGQSARTCCQSSTIRLAEADPSLGDEVSRILHSSDHYSTLGLSRYGKIDFVVLKREYRKKAMLVHPDKNMGNVMAEESFKKLQTAYEVLSDLEKKNAYDEELRKEELTRNFQQKLQSGVQKNGRYDSSQNGFHNFDKEGKDIPAESRRIACRKCNKSHKWIYTNRAKARARWCQECEEYHQATDGDGWMESSDHILFFRLPEEVDMKRAYACIENVIFDVSEWAACQGMNCLPNTHNPSFRMDATLTGKKVLHRSNRSNCHSSRGTNIDEFMTDEDIFELLHMAFSKFDSANDLHENTEMKSRYYGRRNLRKNGNKQW